MERLAFLLLIVAFTSALAAHPAQQDRRQQARLDEALRREGDAVVELAEAAMLGRQTPSDFGMEWRNDFLKAQPGTFVPFTIDIDSSIRSTSGALMYLRVVQRVADSTRRPTTPFAYEAIFPVEVDSATPEPVRV